MLELKKINKIYNVGGNESKALNGVSIKFRDSEFVSILGPSGSGKTTLLNIIGGLDKYTSGDLIINGVSTREYKDSDWDRYRNHSVGFVFQSYNLIMHQTVLANVELALTLSGVGVKERRRKAIKVLKQVGLEDHIYKKPNQLSGGQMQRVAIARALINDPDILLADEPTGALDTKTSVQIMEILKKVADDRLVIMVTHNPELAVEYSTRIVDIKDGKITNDSNKFESKSDEEILKKHKTKKNYMSFKTALSLSLNNLKTKKARTILTSFAGSIGIIGIALILSLSNGINEYINHVEEDTLSNYPLEIDAKQVDTSSLISSLSGKKSEEGTVQDGIITSKNIMGDMFETMTSEIKTNDLRSFREYIENDSKIKKISNAIEYNYNITLNLYKDSDSDVVQVNPTTVLETLGMGNYSSAYSGMMSNYNVWTELMNNNKLLQSQYDVIAGSWPSSYNEVVLIVNSRNEISDYTLYSLGILSQDDLKKNFNAMTSGGEVSFEKTSYKYEDLLGLSYRLLLSSDYYEKSGNIWVDKSSDDNYLLNKIKNAPLIKVVGIVRPNEESVTHSNSSAGLIGYTHDLVEFYINETNNRDIAQEQKSNDKINIFTGREFSNEEFSINNLSNEQRMAMANMSQEEIAMYIKTYTDTIGLNYDSVLEKLGIVDLDNPSSIKIYPKDFDSKESIIDEIDKYNKDASDEKKIEYTDVVGILMSSVTSIVNVISYVLIAFVGISLIVSSIMIGIITYISVLERTKEIGILRAIGASRRDISRVFNAEAVILGGFAGVIGIIVTLILNIPINIIIKNMVNISNISRLPLLGGIILIFISIFLTYIAGLIPSHYASRKDPVIALRSE